MLIWSVPHSCTRIFTFNSKGHCGRNFPLLESWREEFLCHGENDTGPHKACLMTQLSCRNVKCWQPSTVFTLRRVSTSAVTQLTFTTFERDAVTSSELFLKNIFLSSQGWLPATVMILLYFFPHVVIKRSLPEENGMGWDGEICVWLSSSISMADMRKLHLWNPIGSWTVGQGCVDT